MKRTSDLPPLSLNRYKLIIPSLASTIEVESFSGSEAISQMYNYNIYFNSSDKDINDSQLMNKSATLSMGTGLLNNLMEKKVIHGVITDFCRISGSIEESLYQITIEPSLALLGKQFRTHRFFVNKSVPDVIEQVLSEHRLKGWEYEFLLKHTYPKREQINQYQECDLAFIERLLSEVGIFYFFTLQQDTQTEVVHFADKQCAYQFGKSLPLSSPSGMSDTGKDSIWGLSVRHSIAPSSVTTKDYNHRTAHKVLQSVKTDITQGKTRNYGDVYHYKPRHLDTGKKTQPQAETANFYASLDHERFLSTQALITGISTDYNLLPTQVITVTDAAIPSSLPELLSKPMLLIRTNFAGSRSEPLKIIIAAVPYSETLCWRPPLKPRPVVSGTMTARVTSVKTNDIYAWQDSLGLYRVQFDADQDDKPKGQESMPLRLAKPYGGDAYGLHFPLIQGTEVAIAFHDGDLDRPYIAHALHDSRHTDHVTESNNTRNIIRTPAFNKLRMEDKRGEEHIKISTLYGGKTQLNLGHNVDEERKLRGEGAELRTDKWVAVRGGAGVLITADNQPSAGSNMLDMKEAIAQLEGALSIAKSLSAQAEVADTSPADMTTWSRLNESLQNLSQPGIVLNAPQGVSISSPKGIRLSSELESVGIVAGGHADISVIKQFTAVAGEAISLLALKIGIKLIAAKGKLKIQAQKDSIEALACKNITLTSHEDSVTITAAKEILLNCGGAYIKLSNGNIELGCPENIILHSVNVQKKGAKSMIPNLLASPEGEIKPYTESHKDLKNRYH